MRNHIVCALFIATTLVGPVVVLPCIAYHSHNDGCVCYSICSEGKHCLHWTEPEPMFYRCWGNITTCRGTVWHHHSEGTELELEPCWHTGC